MSQQDPTVGEYRVRVSFNPSENPKVNSIKTKAAELITEIDEMFGEEGTSNGDARRLIALAMTAIEEGAMWAVKAVTSQK